MLTFFANCVALFTSVFNAVNELDYFHLLTAVLLLELLFGLFFFIYRGTKKL